MLTPKTNHKYDLLGHAVFGKLHLIAAPGKGTINSIRKQGLVRGG